MKKIEIKLMAFKSLTKGQIDPKKVRNFSSRMKRRELREYLRFLKAVDSKNKVVIEVSDAKTLNKTYLKKLEKIFPHKKIEIVNNPELLAGTRVINDDLIYDYSVENSFDNFIEQI